MTTTNSIGKKVLLSQSQSDQIYQSFIQAISSAGHRPKAVLVSYDLFHELHRRNLIELKLATPFGLPALEAFGLIVPYFEDNIYIHCDPINLPSGDVHFRLPPNP